MRFERFQYRQGSRQFLGTPLWVFFLSFLLLELSHSLASPKEGGKGANRYETEVRSLAREIVRSPSQVSAYIKLLEIGNLRHVVRPEVFAEVLSSVRRAKKLHPQIQLYLKDAERDRKIRSGAFAQAQEEVESGGFFTDWLVIGPFDNEDLKGQEREAGPELDLGEVFSPSIAYDGDERAVSWREATSNPLSGELSLGRFLYPTVKVCGFAGSYFEVPKKMEVVIWGVSSGTLSVWVDGERVIHDGVYRRFGPPRHAAFLRLGKGTHQLLVKVCVDDGEWKVAVRLTDASGRPLSLPRSADPTRLSKPYGGPRGDLEIKAYKTALSELEERASGEKKAEAKGELARYLFLSGSDDTKNKVAQDYALRAAEASGECRDLLTVALTSDQKNRSVKALKDCLAREPSNSRAQFLLLSHLRSSMHLPDYTGMVRWVAQKFPDDPMIAILDATVLSDSGFPILSYEKLKKLRKRFGNIPTLLSEMRWLASTAASQQEEDLLLEESLSDDAGNVSLKMALIDRLLEKGETERAVAETELLVKYFGGSSEVVTFATKALVAMKKTGRAREMLEEEAKLRPHDPSVWQSLGSFYDLTGEKDLALACFQTVLELSPQNVEVRQYVSRRRPEERFETHYIKDEGFLKSLAGKLADGGVKGSPVWGSDEVDVTILVEQEVDRVYKNGMSSRFVQRSLRINSEQGAKLQRYQVISYSPRRHHLKILKARVIRPDFTIEEATARFTVPIVQEEFRLYYDDANEVIEMPPLRPGDVVDLQYKLADSAARNMWERHFGNAVAVKSIYPKIFFRYEVLADEGIQLFTDTPSYERLSVRQSSKEGLRIFTWEASEIPPIVPEPDMPPLAEISPLIRVSTFSSWEEFGAWWWALASEQMIVDKALKEQVAKIIKDLRGEEAKIAALFDWVIRSTRYVGLEFGIHGFKPYKTTEVMSRGFGDCKDKSLLLYVMLKEAGVDAAIALVRTRKAGEMSTSFPFQFFFDHAIVAVPSKNLFLDPTVDYLDYATLPPPNQGVFSLIISDGRVETRLTPTGSPLANNQETHLSVRLQPNGDALLDGEISATGVAAALLRSRYQTTGTRQERLEESLGSILPGVKLSWLSFEGLDDYTKEIDIRFTAMVPALAMVSGEEMQVVAMPSYGLQKTYASRSKREYPLVVGSPQRLADHFTYHAPEGFVFSSLPKSAKLGGEGSGFSLIFEVKALGPSKVEIRSVLEIASYRIAPARYAEFREFCRKADDTLSQRLHLMKILP